MDLRIGTIQYGMVIAAIPTIPDRVIAGSLFKASLNQANRDIVADCSQFSIGIFDGDTIRRASSIKKKK